jgi:hypothetical protein
VQGGGNQHRIACDALDHGMKRLQSERLSVLVRAVVCIRSLNTRRFHLTASRNLSKVHTGGDGLVIMVEVEHVTELTLSHDRPLIVGRVLRVEVITDPVIGGWVQGMRGVCTA